MSEHSDPDDHTLLADFRDHRSEPAFTELVRRHLPLVFHVAQRRLGSAALAEEAAQNAFTRLAVKAGAVARHPERLRAWLHRTAYFEACTLARKETRLSRLPIPHEPHLTVNRPEIYDQLDDALSKLPELDRELVLRHCCGGEDYRRMAAAVGKSEASCQKRVERALARLGKGLGGPKTAGVVIAALAASSMKSQALPAAGRIAKVAIESSSTAGSAIGTISGIQVAACAAMILAGTAAGWKQDSTATAVRAPQRIAPVTKANRDRAPVSVNAQLAPRQASPDRTLDEVLESILAGQLLPLVEYLPKASATDLQAIMGEDDLGNLSEGMGSFLAAHGLAAQRWVEIDPEAAFSYGVQRSTTLAAQMLARWMSQDPSAASAAFLGCSKWQRSKIARTMVTENDTAAGKLAAIDPSVAWIVTEERIYQPDPEAERQEATALISRMISGEKPDDGQFMKMANAFFLLSHHDPESARKLAESIPWEDWRGIMLARISPGSTAGLPAGPMRSEALVLESAQHMASDPEAVIRQVTGMTPGAGRDAVFSAVSSSLAGSDPWRLISMVGSLEGYLAKGGSDLVRALTFAGADDPRRALSAVPGIAAHLDVYGGPQEFAKAVLKGWLGKDPVAAIRWAADVGVFPNSEDLGSAPGGAEPFLKLLESADEKLASIARNGLTEPLARAVANGEAAPMLARIPQPIADDMLKWQAWTAALSNDLPAAERIAALASDSARAKSILPMMALGALRHDPGRAIEWMNSLPQADRRHAADGLEKMFRESTYGDDAEKFRPLLQHLQP